MDFGLDSHSYRRLKEATTEFVSVIHGPRLLELLLLLTSFLLHRLVGVFVRLALLSL
jgi:hypothetical protein